MTSKALLLICACHVALGAGTNLVVATQKAEILTTPRPSATETELLFAYVNSSSTAGFDTEITISNTSLDTLGSTPQAGTCSLNFYGLTNELDASASFAATTPAIAAGQQLVFNLSQGGSGIPAAPDFLGYVSADCGFPLARGFAKLLGIFTGTGFAQDAQVVTLPQSTSSPQYLLFPLVTNKPGVVDLAQGFETLLSVVNPSSIDSGGQSGYCALYPYGVEVSYSGFENPSPPPLLGCNQVQNPISGENCFPLVTAGSLQSVLVSQVFPGFQGYVVAACGFAGAAGFAYAIDFATSGSAILSEAPEVLTPPRAATVTPLLFSFVSNQNGWDTNITISNTSSDPIGTAAASGSCTLDFFGGSSPVSVSTGTIAAGSSYSTLVSAVAPGFQGYAMAVCSFPYARGMVYRTSGGTPDGHSEDAELVTTPRNGIPAPLLFPAVTNWTGSDTSITISNTSRDTLGTAPGSGKCTFSYFGAMLGGGSLPAAQTSTTILPGSQLSFTLSQGNTAQGIAATPGFRGYIIADCNFPLARGVSTVLNLIPPPVLSVSATHTGNFYQGEIGATSTITVSNRGAGQTIGTVTVDDSPAAGMQVVSMAGAGWTCPIAYRCTRSDALASGASYPTITVTLDVAANAVTPGANYVAASGGSSALAGTFDDVVIVQTGHPVFFTGESTVNGTNFDLWFPDGKPFGDYAYLVSLTYSGAWLWSGWIYHADMGYEYVTPGNGPEVYLWDLASGHWFYTNVSLFPYLYDFTLKAWIYYFPATNNAGHYTTNPRYFANMTTGQIFTM